MASFFKPHTSPTNHSNYHTFCAHQSRSSSGALSGCSRSRGRSRSRDEPKILDGNHSLEECARNDICTAPELQNNSPNQDNDWERVSKHSSWSWNGQADSEKAPYRVCGHECQLELSEDHDLVSVGHKTGPWGTHEHIWVNVGAHLRRQLIEPTKVQQTKHETRDTDREAAQECVSDSAGAVVFFTVLITVIAILGAYNVLSGRTSAIVMLIIFGYENVATFGWLYEFCMLKRQQTTSTADDGRLSDAEQAAATSSNVVDDERKEPPGWLKAASFITFFFKFLTVVIILSALATDSSLSTEQRWSKMRVLVGVASWIDVGLVLFMGSDKVQEAVKEIRRRERPGLGNRNGCNV